MQVGATEDQAKQNTLVEAKAKLDLLRAVGFDAVGVTSIWAPGLQAPTEAERGQLANLAVAAQLAGMQVFVAVQNAGSRTTPLSEQDQGDFAAYAAAIVGIDPYLKNLIVGNEPNLNRFWLPQFGPDGSDAAAAAYLSLLARTYDALKAADPDVIVIGGALAPRGIDRPGTKRDTHSPTLFIRDLGSAYRASGRALPVMDELAVHPWGENSSVPPTAAHPNTTPIGIADYPKLATLLAQAFDGTAQAGSSLPIVYSEYGVETTVPPDKAPLYSGQEPDTTKPIDEATQATYFRQAIALAFCQPSVRGLLFFHAIDEGDLDRLQSGVYYADGTTKTSLEPVKQAIRDSSGGVIARCPGLGLTPSAKARFPSGIALSRVPLTIRVTCDIDCNYYARLELLPKGSTTFAKGGRAQAEVSTLIDLPARRVRHGRYRFTLRLTAPVNVGPPRVLVSAPVTIP